MRISNEHLITQLVSYVTSVSDVDVEQAKTDLSALLADYSVSVVDPELVHPDLRGNIESFLAAKRLDGLAPLTLDNYARDLRIFSEDVKKRTEDITTGDLRNHLSKFPHLKKSSLGRKLNVLRSFFGWLASEDILMRDPSKKLKNPKKEKRFPKALTIEELELLRESCVTVRQRAFIEVLYATGCRLSEVKNLDRSDIDQHSRSCRVIGKGDKEREVYFSYKAMYHLNKYLNSRTDDEPALMVSQRRPYRRLAGRTIQREIAVIAKQAGLEKKVTPHTLRHTFATVLLNSGADITAVQGLLGHESVSTTQIYAQLSQEKKREQHNRYLVQ